MTNQVHDGHCCIYQFYVAIPADHPTPTRSRNPHSGGSAKQTRHIMQVLDNDGDGEITLDEYIRANRKVGTLMFPAFR